MSYFDVNPTSSSEVVILAAGTGTVRFLALGISNDSAATQITLTITDGAAGTVRFRMCLAAGQSQYCFTNSPGSAVLPRTWWTSGNAVVCALSGSSSVRVFGEVVREA